MKKRKSKNKGIDDIVDELIDLPSKNLEARIDILKSEIGLRRNILYEALIQLGNQTIQLQDKIWRMRYTGIIGSGVKVKVDLEKDLAITEIRKTEELVSYFRDVQKLKDKLQMAKEELEMERQKRRLVDG